MQRFKQIRSVSLPLVLLLPLVVLLVFAGPPPPAAPPDKTTRCPEASPLLIGALNVDVGTKVSLEQTLKENPNVEAGGRYGPRECVSSQKVAVIIPFRHREEHLTFWLHYLHPVLQRQQLDYTVYVVQQHGEETFNRAKLLNIGFAEALKDRDYNCFVFSDVDLIPMNDRHEYGCFSQPRHLAAALEKWNFQLPYSTFFGGVTSMSKGQFLKINGFPNNYWGWGGEDDDAYNRVMLVGMSVSRPNGEVTKMKNIPHAKDKGNPVNTESWNQVTHTKWTWTTDGINSLSYKVVRTTRGPLYTNVTVDIGKRPVIQ